MSSLHPPSPSASPGPAGRSPNFRASMGPAARPNVAGGGLPPSPRPGGVSGAGRPTSELLGSSSMFQSAEAEAIDQWFETFQNYEVTLEEMAAASLDANFKEELSAIEQWFKVLSEAERTAALYSLLQHSTQVQIRFFITVLQQMARADPMTALLSPAVGGSMQSQMEAKLASMNLKSPGLMSGLPASPTARNFSANRASLGPDAANGFLSPESANNLPNGDPAMTLAQQRAKLKASNPAHRISAPVLSSTLGPDGRPWGSPPLAELDERAASPAQEITIPSAGTASRPKSTDFSGVANAFKSPRPGAEDALSPMAGDSWASMVNTPLLPMFKDTRGAGQSLDAAAAKLNEWSAGGGQAVPLIADPPKKFNRLSKGAEPGGNGGGGFADEQRGALRGPGGGGGAGPLHAFGGQNGWGGARSPAGAGRFGDENAHGLGLPNFNMGLASPGLGLPGGGLNMAAFAAAGMPLSPFGNMFNVGSLGAMGVSPEQMLAMQMAAAGQLGQAGLGGFGMAPQRGRGAGGVRSPGKSPAGREAKKDDEDVDPKLLDDIPAWLRSLRLHKYTPNFEGMHWRDMVAMDEAALEAQGVAALGARRKMLKTFEVVRAKMGIDSPGGASTPSNA